MRGVTGTRVRPVFALLAFASGLALALAGCSGSKPTAGTLSSSAPVPSSSASVSPSPTVTPVEAQVEAAVRTYYAELTEAAQTNDTSVLKTLSTQGCPCYRPVRVIDAGAKRGEISPDATWTVESVKIKKILDRTALAEVHYQVSAYDVVNKSGGVVDSYAAKKQHLDLSLVRSAAGSWILTNVINLEG